MERSILSWDDFRLLTAVNLRRHVPRRGSDGYAFLTGIERNLSLAALVALQIGFT